MTDVPTEAEYAEIRRNFELLDRVKVRLHVTRDEDVVPAVESLISAIEHYRRASRPAGDRGPGGPSDRQQPEALRHASGDIPPRPHRVTDSTPVDSPGAPAGSPRMGMRRAGN